MMETLEKALAHLPLGGWRYYAQIGSTMDAAEDWLKAGAADFSLVVANEQTAGRGRFQRHWYTPPDSALAFSLILRPRGDNEKRYSMLFTGLGAVAVAEALERLYGLQPQIKWPNDVLLNGKKVCGILNEAHWQGEELLGIVLGIGINVAPSSVPPVTAVLFPATCVEDCLPSSIHRAPVRVDRFQLLAGVLEGILKWRTDLQTPAFLQSWEARLAYRNQPVQAFLDLEKEAGSQAKPLAEGIIQGLNADGSLRLMTQDGTIQSLTVGELSLRAG